MSMRPTPETRRSVPDDAGLAELVRFQRDLYLYWRAVCDTGTLSLTTRGYLTRTALRRLRPRLAIAPDSRIAEPQEVDDPRGLFVRRLLQRLGLLRVEDDADKDRAVDTRTRGGTVLKLRAADDALAKRFFSQSLDDRLRICLRVWIAGGWWPDHLDGRVPPPRLMAPLPPRVALARRQLLEMLAARGVGVPVIRPPSPQHATRPAHSPRGHTRKLQIAPMADADQAAAAALNGPLLWLGLVAHVEGEPSSTSALRVGRPVEALPVTSTTVVLAEHHGRLTVLPDFTLIGYPPLTAPELFAVDFFAERVALDQAARYRITRQSVARARRGGMSTEAIESTLERLSGAPVPQNVRTSLRDWERQGERVRLTSGYDVLRVEDARLLDQILASETTARWLERRLSPTAALIAAGCSAQVRSWLLRRGVLAAVRHPERPPTET